MRKHEAKIFVVQRVSFASGSSTWLLLDNLVYIELIGFLAVFFEALLGMPQFLRNHRMKSTEGMSVKMVRLSPFLIVIVRLGWTSFDRFFLFRC